MKLQAIACHLEDRLSIPKVEKYLPFEVKRKEHSFLLLEVDKQSFIYVKDYGCLVFINCTKSLINETIHSTVNSSIEVDTLPKEEYDIYIEPETRLQVKFDSIHIDRFNIDIAHVVMLNLAQSVALENYLNMSIRLLDRTQFHCNELHKNGKVSLSRKNLRKLIGETMNINNRIAKNLYIFKSPDIAWSEEQLSILDKKLSDELDVVIRYEGLQQNINICKEHLGFFQTILQHKHSSTLEWIIIILILFEVAHIFI